jgi:hypothetical protein
MRCPLAFLLRQGVQSQAGGDPLSRAGCQTQGKKAEGEALLTSSGWESSPKLEEILSAELAVRPKVRRLKERPC